MPVAAVGLRARPLGAVPRMPRRALLAASARRRGVRALTDGASEHPCIAGADESQAESPSAASCRPRASTWSWGSGPRCCSSPPPSARPAAPPAAPWPTSPRPCPGVAARRGRRRAPPRAGPPPRRPAHADHAGPRRAAAPRSPAPPARRARSRCSPRWRLGRDVRHVDRRLACRDDDYRPRRPLALRLAVMSSTMLTKRRAVDHCRVRSSLCRMS